MYFAPLWGNGMKAFLSSNIGNKGRVFRGGCAIACFIGAWFAFPVSIWLGVLLIAAGSLAVFEAARCWCLMRACGIKTRF
jgi:hypothetical protein